MSWSIEILAEAEKEIRQLPSDMQARFIHIGELLTTNGPSNVGMPHVRFLRDKLWEMRMTGRDGIARAIYFQSSGRRLIVVRAFVKKTRQTPDNEITIAARRMGEFRNAEDDELREPQDRASRRARDKKRVRRSRE